MKRLLALIAVAFLVAAAPAAFAQFPNQQQPAAAAVGGPIGSPTIVIPPSKAPISISPAFADFLQPYIDAITNAIILAAAGWAFTWLKTHMGVNLDQKHRDAITLALQNQAGSLIADGMVKVEAGKVDVHSPALAAAAREVMLVVPDAAKHFGLTPEHVAARIVDTIPQIAAGAQMVAQSVAAAAKPPKAEEGANLP